MLSFKSFVPTFATSALLLASLFALMPVSSSAAIAVDAVVSADQGSAKASVSSPAFSTSASNELILAFVATDYLGGTNTSVTGVSGAGLTWNLVVRTNVQSGTAEIWRAFATSTVNAGVVTASLSQSVGSTITVVSFAGVNISGVNGAGAIGATKSANAKSGAPTASLITTANGSWVFGVGNDFDNAVARKAGVGQTVVHQFLSPAGDTYWVQMQNAATPLSGTTVSINDTAPTGDRYNLSLCEIVPAAGGSPTFSISGNVSPSASGVSVALTGAAQSSTTTDSSGNYVFANLANGSYTLAPSKAGFTFAPLSQNVTVNGSNDANVNFTELPVLTYAISGTISPAASGSGATVTLSGASSAMTTADGSGNFTFSGLANGSYTLTPGKSGFTFNPSSLPEVVSNANVAGANFTAVSAAKWSISGTITPATAGSAATVVLSGAATGSTAADASGNYSFNLLANGSYIVTPSKSGYSFLPANQAVTVSGANASANFTGQASTEWECWQSTHKYLTTLPRPVPRSNLRRCPPRREMSCCWRSWILTFLAAATPPSPALPWRANLGSRSSQQWAERLGRNLARLRSHPGFECCGYRESFAKRSGKYHGNELHRRGYHWRERRRCDRCYQKRQCQLRGADCFGRDDAKQFLGVRHWQRLR